MAREWDNPTLLAIIVCDAIYRDPTTQKCSLLGLFNSISARQFPCTHERLNIYISLTDGRGKAKGEIRLVHQHTNKTVFQLQGEIVFPDPLSTTELAFEINRLPLPEPGPYTFDFYCNEALVGSRPFVVKAVTATS